MTSLLLKAATVGAICVPSVVLAAEQTKTLGNLQADYVVAPGAKGGSASDLAGTSAPKIDPRTLLGPAKAVILQGPLPAGAK